MMTRMPSTTPTRQPSTISERRHGFGIRLVDSIITVGLRPVLVTGCARHATGSGKGRLLSYGARDLF